MTPGVWAKNQFAIVAMEDARRHNALALGADSQIRMIIAMHDRSLSDRIVDVLACSSRDANEWPPAIRSDCAVIHARYDALRLDKPDDVAWREAQAEWVRRAMRDAGLVRVVYRFRAR